MKKIFFWLFFGFSLAAFGVLIFFGITIRQVRCFLNDREMSLDFPVCAQLQQLAGSRLLFRDFYRDSSVAPLLYDSVTKETFDITRIEKSLSGTTVFFLSDQPPLYRIQQENEVVLVTHSGGFRENNDQVQVPLLIDPAGLYQRDPAVHQFLAEFLLALADKKDRISQITLFAAERIELKIPGFPTTLIELRQNPRQTAARLSVILEKLSPDEIDLAIQELDLRLELPVLRTTESSDSGEVLLDSQE